MKVLQFQNKKLVERIEQRRKAEEELRKRIEQLEQRQTTDDAVLCIVNRYWNQLDEDVRVLLQRFDAEGADESGKKNESTAVTAFLTLLSQWDKPEIEDKLRQRVEFSKRAIGKLLQAYDRLLQRHDKLWEGIKGKSEEDGLTVKKEDSKDDLEKELKKEIKKEPMDGERDDGTTKDDVTKDGANDSGAKDSKGDLKKLAGDTEERPFSLSEAVKEEVERLKAENKRLQDLTSELHQRHHETDLKNSELSDKLAAAETGVAELRNQVEDVEYQLAGANLQVEKLDRHLADTMQRLHTYQEGEILVQGGGEGVSKNKFNEILAELEEQRELATNRLNELEKLQREHQEAVREVEKLKTDLATLPENVLVETTEYKCLQSQFSVLYNESMTLSAKLEESKQMLSGSKNSHLRQIEQMESDELCCQKKLRNELIQLEDQLSQVRREYEMLRIEFEQTLAANEQTGPINREMRNLITSLKNHNEQLKGEIARYKRKLKETQAEVNKLKTELNLAQNSVTDQAPTPSSTCPTCSGQTADRSACSTPTAGGGRLGVGDKEASPPKERRSQDASPPLLGADDPEDPEGAAGAAAGGSVAPSTPAKDKASVSTEVRELKAELKKSQDREKELKLLLDMYKSAPKETRDKCQLLAIEKRAKQEIEDLRGQVRRLQEAERKEKRKLADDEAIKKIKRLEDTTSELSKALIAQKQEEEALLNEMEVTGQAFEDMQEQNIRLLQQLREKDDANFKLMSERIKSNQIHKLLREEKEILAEQVGTVHHQVEAQNVVVRKLEEKERILQNNLETVEKELGLRQQSLEVHKRKAIESAQTAADLKLHLDKYHAQLKESQVAVGDKTIALQQQSFKYKRIQEEVASLRRKVERAKKIEMASSADEVLLEEIREYKEQLTCPSCKVKKKDAVLTKCFHVFCLDCLKTRYETRQRKCPKCNAAFGANDYHRIYLDV